MNHLWVAILAGLIVREKNGSQGERVARAAAVAFTVPGTVLLLHPSRLAHLTYQ